MQVEVVAGRMQRAIMTLAPGAACLLVGMFTLMAGLNPYPTPGNTLQDAYIFAK